MRDGGGGVAWSRGAVTQAGVAGGAKAEAPRVALEGWGKAFVWQEVSEGRGKALAWQEVSEGWGKGGVGPQGRQMQAKLKNVGAPHVGPSASDQPPGGGKRFIIAEYHPEYH